MTDECLACALAAGRRPLPGGRIFRTEFWLVEHCVGPLGLGTLIVKPERHVTTVAGLSAAEAAELGPLLGGLLGRGQLVAVPTRSTTACGRTSAAARHIHYVVQPVTREQMAATPSARPPVAMSRARDFPDEAEVARLAERARRLFAPGPSADGPVSPRRGRCEAGCRPRRRARRRRASPWPW